MKTFFTLFFLLLGFSSNAQSIDLSRNYIFKKDSFSYILDCNERSNYLKAYDYLYDKNFSNNYINSLNAIGLYAYAKSTDSVEIIGKKSVFRLKYEDKDTISLDAILSKVKRNGILIINEEHLRMETRVINYNMLPLLKKHNFTHLAMEALSDTKDNGYVSYKNGYYFIEPIQAEILRKARALGFQIVEYDTFIVEPSKRDSLQAFHLNNIMKQNDSIKMVVIAGQSHGAEDCDFCPPLMGRFLKDLYKIDPVTIDQTRGVDFTTTLDISFVGKRRDCYLSSDFVKKNIGFGMFDYFYLHPKNTKISDWTSLMYDRKEYTLPCKNKNASMVQVYLKKEYDIDKGDFCTPVLIRTNVNPSGNFLLYLRPQNEYVIVYRDTENRIMDTQNFYAK